MRNLDKFRKRGALFLPSTLGLLLIVAGCTSVEYTAKEGIDGRKITTVIPFTQDAITTTPAQVKKASSALPANALAAQLADSSVATQAAALPTATAVKSGCVAALPPASETVAAADISAQMQPAYHIKTAQKTLPYTTSPAAGPVVTSLETADPAAKPAHSAAADLPQMVAVKGSYLPAPPPEKPSIGTELSAEHKFIPLRKPDRAVLAYASDPTNAALSAINNNETLIAPMNHSPAGRDKFSGLITKYATMYNVPEDLVHRVVQHESKYNPGAYNGGHFGLMQIKHATARSMGFDGPASALFDAETNFRYAVKYLRGAWLVADNNRDNAVRLYARGYYYDAKRKGMLHVLRK